MIKFFKITFFIACTIVTMVGCLDSTGSEPKPIVEPSSISHFSIANQSGFDLNVRYNRHVDIDSTIAVLSDSITLILKSSGIGYPTPSEALAKLRFYNADGDTASPVFTVEPIIDENCNDMTAEGDTAKKYELVITDGDIE